MQPLITAIHQSGLSLREIARLTEIDGQPGVSHANISRWLRSPESVGISLQTAERIANALGYELSLKKQPKAIIV